MAGKRTTITERRTRIRRVRFLLSLAMFYTGINLERDLGKSDEHALYAFRELRDYLKDAGVVVEQTPNLAQDLKDSLQDIRQHPRV
jgi:hypothetical protein